MSLSEEARTRRLRRLHAKLLDAAEKYPSLYHLACRSDDTRLWRAFCPTWLAEGGNCHGTRLRGPTLRALARDWLTERAAPAESHVQAHEWVWGEAVEYGRFGRYGSCSFVSLAHRLVFEGQEWMGRFADPRCELGDHLCSSFHFEHIELFENLSSEATVDFGSAPETAMPLSFEDEAEGRRGEWRHSWLETVYKLVAPPIEREDDPAHPLLQLRSGASFLVTGLPWNIFLASARAIELLGQNPLKTPTLPDATLAAAVVLDQRENDDTSCVTERPAYKRDHLWLRWSEQEELTPAPIRNRWNALSDDDRRGICSSAYNKIAKGEGGRQVVIKALKLARSEKALANP